MSKGLLVWGTSHIGNGGYNTNIFESKTTPVDLRDSLSDLRQDNILKGDNSRFYSVSLSANHRIYSIYTYSEDKQHRNGFTAISIYTNKNKVLSNIFESLNKALALYLDKKDSTFDNMFEQILDNTEEFENCNADEDKSSGTSCFYGTGENHINHFLSASNTQQYQKVYITHDNEKIKEQYPAYTNQKKYDRINTPITPKGVNKITYIYAGGSVVLIIILGWFISTLFNAPNSGKSKITEKTITEGQEKKDISEEKFGDYQIRLTITDGEEKYYWAKENGPEVTEMTRRIILTTKNQDKIKEDNNWSDVLKNLKSSIQTELTSEGGIEILLYKDGNSPDDFLNNIEKLQELEDKLTPKQIRYSKGSFQVKTGEYWKKVEDENLYTQKIFKSYLQGIDDEGEEVATTKTPEKPKTTEEDPNAGEIQAPEEEKPGQATEPKLTINNEVIKPEPCTKHTLVDIEQLETDIDPKQFESSKRKIEKEIKKLDNCKKCKVKERSLEELLSELREGVE